MDEGEQTDADQGIDEIPVMLNLTAIDKVGAIDDKVGRTVDKSEAKIASKSGGTSHGVVETTLKAKNSSVDLGRGANHK